MGKVTHAAGGGKLVGHLADGTLGIRGSIQAGTQIRHQVWRGTAAQPSPPPSL